MSAESDKLMKVILTLDNKKAKENMIDKMVTNYCERRKQKFVYKIRKGWLDHDYLRCGEE